MILSTPIIFIIFFLTIILFFYYTFLYDKNKSGYKILYNLAYYIGCLFTMNFLLLIINAQPYLIIIGSIAFLISIIFILDNLLFTYIFDKNKKLNDSIISKPTTLHNLSSLEKQFDDLLENI